MRVWAASTTAIRSCSCDRLCEGGARGGGDIFAEPVRHRIEPLAHHAREIGLPAAEHFGKRLHAAAVLGLDAHELGDALLQVGGLVGARAAGARMRDQERDEQNEHGGAQRQQRMRGGDLGSEQP